MLFAPKKQTGFTIVELLIVIVVIGILAAITVVAFNGVQERAAAGILQSDLRNAATQLEIAKVTNNDQYIGEGSIGDLSPSEGTSFDFTSDGSSYCLTAFSNRSGVPSYYISSTTGLVQEGACPGHSDPLLTPALPFQEVTKLTASDAAADDQFGYSVAISGDTAVVGSYFDDNVATNAGAAYVYIRSGATWTEQAKLTASDAAADDQFGYSVAIVDDTVIVGAFADDNGSSNTGSAYIFTRSGVTWTQQAKLTASDPAAFDQFGSKVAVSGDTALIGAFADDDAGSSSGSAYIFTRSGVTWTQQAKLTASDPAASDFFGGAVSINADTAVIGAYGNDDAGSFSGSAYVFTRSGVTWTQQAKLTASDAASFDYFGNSVAVSGDSILVGAFGATTSSGSAYVFTRSGVTWTQQAEIRAGDAATGDNFGYSVALSGDRAIVGAYNNDDAGSSSGSAYIFTRSGVTWTEQLELNASDAAATDQFGFTVSIDGESAAVGAHLNDDAGTSSGSAYIFE